MKKRKILSAFAALVVLLTPALTGCSGEKPDTDPNNPLLVAVSQSSDQSSVQPSETVSEPVSTVEPSTQVSDTSAESIPDISQPSAEPSADVSQSSSPAEAITPALWKAENADGNSIYLMGSIHMGDSDVNYMPDYITSAYALSDSIAVEADISVYLDNSAKALELMSLIRYDDGTTIKDHISEETYNKAVERLTAFNMYSPLYDTFKAYMWQSLLTNTFKDTSGLDVYHGVDYMFLKKAQADNKDIIEIESMEEQIELFGSYSDELTDLILSQMLEDNYAEYASASERALYEAWKQGKLDEALLYSTNFSDTDNISDPLYQEYFEKMIYTRNRTMADAAEQYIESGQKVFVLVGAFHYVGNKGIISLLENDGYTVTRVG